MFLGSDRPSWSVDGADWPNRVASRMVTAGGLRWHVQIMGEGPDLLLLHGTGAATHSWRDLLPLLAGHRRVIAPDLPGHGFTGMPPSRGLTLPGMAEAVLSLMEALGASPRAGVGHSAGAAILTDIAVRQDSTLRGIVALNGAMLPIRHAGLFAPLAKMLFLNPLVPRLFAFRGSSAVAVKGLIEGTGSHLDARGIELYRRLLGRAGHIEGALGMMASWNLDRLRADLSRLDVPLVLVTTPDDRAVPPSDADRVCALTPMARHVRFATGGHLAHEEHPERMAACITGLLDTFDGATV